MHLFQGFTLFLVLTLIGVEFSVAAFFNPAARLLDPEPQKLLLGRLAAILGKVMPVWYPLCAVLFVVETWLLWRTAGRPALLLADALWVAASLGSIALLVPLNTRIANGDPA